MFLKKRRKTGDLSEVEQLFGVKLGSSNDGLENKQVHESNEDKNIPSENNNDDNGYDSNEIEESKPVVTVFKELSKVEESSINHKSLDGKGGDVALTVAQRKMLKRKRQETTENEQKKMSEMLKKLRKGDRFDVEKSSYAVRSKSERQREIDKLHFETKKFVFSQTMNSKDYERFMEEEKMKQGKEFKRIKGDYINYKQLLDQKKEEKERKERERMDALSDGNFNFKESRKEKFKSEAKKEKQQILEFARMGAPNEIGKVDWRLKRKTKVGVGSVGKWDNGVLHISPHEMKEMNSVPTSITNSKKQKKRKR